jgi:DNA ligase D-like protein (predicted 3'-phosphoesterase)
LILRHTRRKAKGIPDRDLYRPIPQKKGVWDYVVQEHHAHRAGKHYDLRLSPDRHAYSWALRRLPKEPGQKVLAVEQPTHTRKYMDWEGNIPAGYGAGDVQKIGRGEVEVVETSANKIIFNKYVGKQTREYIMIRTSDKHWLLMNNSTYEGKYKL